MINKLILSAMLFLASLGVISEVIVNDLGMTESDLNKSTASVASDKLWPRTKSVARGSVPQVKA
ncbi:MAG: hypothetical protein A2381_16690 [Bdellovibrionales bacterium RIFOXYB1_FULL_37_110]|nr:MAG: hypothetical protein A2181_07695 [Bdellovibrionales bacterium RIFOXYA1_FULL_38_20]OFZ59942.1 MAG: hypothetical protein A2381_16690 [Bdellovibrionales bacterium RIFOXYB1_FULL_37_110]OFZ63913.1 MAG: hypothetical protein A2577_05880 [Bdellovibrionales bacterium RIFOXYD1_FULL_36_51]